MNFLKLYELLYIRFPLESKIQPAYITYMCLFWNFCMLSLFKYSRVSVKECNKMCRINYPLLPLVSYKWRAEVKPNLSKYWGQNSFHVQLGVRALRLKSQGTDISGYKDSIFHGKWTKTRWKSQNWKQKFLYSILEMLTSFFAKVS